MSPEVDKKTANIEGMTPRQVQRVLTLMGIWTCFGLMFWLLAKLWSVLLALGG
ncbi:hypothetical protein [Bradyrhizobium liaoningense]|uniref:hypothetical protein n=1 Tax=Bradyrhizobium liaoningense TaxID=43992 RepID=UPI001BA91467|nr:hypothetical protein [Bradyrhizobium liaoningense]MBR0823531.1 hypothetical protein [Bradyrhizobium liaoningense]